jgi:hypothetical protein
MSARWIWTLASISVYSAIFLFARFPGVNPWLYGLLYGLLGTVLLGTISRWWVRGSAALWRPAMLGLGSLAAAGEIGLRVGTHSESLQQQWMVALLGLLTVAVVMRLTPLTLTRRWLGIDRRVHDRGV